jgi:nitroimidazol reductase NimA-like FMN-containing flavoprotein (pyridoxamine 5'-phosphate oxidase superfamily)
MQRHDGSAIEDERDRHVDWPKIHEVDLPTGPVRRYALDMPATVRPTDRTRLRRLPQRGSYDLDVITAILDDALICHAAFSVDEQPYALPMAFGRIGTQVYLHAASVGRLVRGAAAGLSMCVTVTLVDGLVLARSAFHHSINYRSVVVLGRARLVDDPGEKEAALRAIVNHVVPDRWDEVRAPSVQELKATGVLALALEEASAKIRTGGPIDDEDDYARPVWAGVVPLRTTISTPVPDARLGDDVRMFAVARIRTGTINRGVTSTDDTENR